jgi:hypothetical protein
VSDSRLSRPTSQAGQLQRACLTLLREHEADGALPTSERFIWYELVQRGVVDKTKARGHPGVRRGVDQDVSRALTDLRERGVVPWDWLVDETRVVSAWKYAPTVAEYIDEAVDRARIDLWDGEPPPLLLVESRSLAGVLRNLAADYLVPLAATNGQVGGFLHTDVVPLLTKNRRVLYLGDHDLSGHQIEANTRRVLERYELLRWERLALLPEHVRAYGLPLVSKTDNRYQPARVHQAVETEALSQRVVIDLVRDRLDQLLPEPLRQVQVREQRQREETRRRLA